MYPVVVPVCAIWHFLAQTRVLAHTWLVNAERERGGRQHSSPGRRRRRRDKEGKGIKPRTSH